MTWHFFPSTPSGQDATAPPTRLNWYNWRRLGFNFLTISIIVHLFLGLGAGYLIVQTIHAKRKQTFAGASQSPTAPARALEHKVQLQKKQQTMSAPRGAQADHHDRSNESHFAGNASDAKDGIGRRSVGDGGHGAGWVRV